MTGMGNDGAEAMTQLSRQGGRTIAEAEETRSSGACPANWSRPGGADWVVPLPEIADRCSR
jgi:two-component system chemotaxis response regulator CheB